MIPSNNMERDESLVDAAGADQTLVQVLQGNEFYRLGQFSDSFDKYAGAIDQGAMSVGAYYNFSNAAFRLGDPVLAVAGFRIAQDLAPRDAEVTANITFAQTAAGVPARAGVASWHEYMPWVRYLSSQEYLLALSAVVTAVFVCLSVSLIMRSSAARFAAALKIASVVLGVLGVLLGSCFFVNWDRMAPRARGIVLVNKASLRSEAAAESLELFSLPRGAEFRVLEEIPAHHTDRLSYVPLAREARKPISGGWIRVRYDNETRGWLKSDDVLVF